MPSQSKSQVPQNYYVLRIYPITQRDADFSLRTDQAVIQSTIESIHNPSLNNGPDTPSTGLCSASLSEAPANQR
jgi:hypothetical protein